MNTQGFFLPTPKFKEYLLLSTIEQGALLTQREIAKAIGIAVSMVNLYLEDFESKGFVKRTANSKKDVRYHITEKGIEEKKLLNIDFLKSSINVYNIAKDNVIPYLNKICSSGRKNIYLYGAGEVAELFINVIRHEDINLNILGLIDDNSLKVGKELSSYKIYPVDILKNNDFDLVVISSYRHKDQIISNILKYTNESKIVMPYLEDNE